MSVASSRYSSTVPISGIMTSGLTRIRFLPANCRRLEDRARLHFIDVGESDPQPAATMAQHRVGLGKGVHLGLDGLQASDPARGRGSLELRLLRREELV